MPVFLLLFIILPVAELAVLIQVGSVIGVLNTEDYRYGYRGSDCKLARLFRKRNNTTNHWD